jgi:phosphate acetyltransferase
MADGSVAGAWHTTGDVVRSALQVIGVDKRYSLVSSFFLVLMYEDFHPVKGGVIFADCGLVVSPSEDELAQIAAAAADSTQNLLNVEPKIAMLSFSTRGSAKHPDVEKVENATKRLREMRPDVLVESAIQFDAAFVPEVAKIKAPGSDVAGQANVFIFPDLNSGNIGYKIAERVGQVRAIGPIMQGLAKPANDLSRGCDAEAVYGMITVTVVQAQTTTG